MSILNKAELNQAAWIKIKRHYKARLEVLRKQNDDRLSAEDTAILRGQIKEIKTLLDIEKERPEFAEASNAEV